MRLLLITRALFFALLVAGAASAQNVVWTQPFGVASENAGLAVAKDGSVLLAYTSTPCNSTEAIDYNRLGIARVGADGKVRYDIALARPKEVDKLRRGGTIYGRIDGVVALDDGDALVAVEFVEGSAWLLRLDDKGGVAFMKPITDPNGAPAWRSINSVVRTSDGNIVVSGHARGDFYAAKFADNGRMLWEKIVDGGRADILVDLAADADGGVVAAGLVASVESTRPVAPDTAILRIDTAGVVTADRRFRGESPRVAFAEGRVAVTYTRPESEQPLRFRTFDGALSAEVVEVPLPTRSTQHEVIAGSGGSFVVVTKDDTMKAMVASMSARGAKNWELRGIDLTMALHLRAARAGDDVVIAWDDPTGPCVRANLSRVSTRK